jgi:hypothetical protein
MKLILVLALATALATAAALPGAAAAVDVYKWTDAKGVVHYGDYPASGVTVTTVSVPGGGSSAQERAAAAASLDADRKKLQQAGARKPSRAGYSPQPVQKTVESSCAASWREYDADQACFDANRNGGGRGVSERGAALCKEIPQPDCAR